MSCLVSYSESSDEDEDKRNNLASVTDVKLCQLDHEDKRIVNISDHCHFTSANATDTVIQEKNSQRLLKPVETLVARSAPPSFENRFEMQQLRRKRKLDCREKLPLNLPNSIQTMYKDNQNKPKDNPALHQNRVRSFPHEVGNWATHVFIPVHQDERFVSFVQNLMKQLLPQGFEILPEFHVSLSRTVVVRHHWIEPLVNSLKDKLQHISTSICEIVDVKLFSNDEKTRTFVCLELSEDDTELLKYVEAVDNCFKDFRLAPYYENPSFHISIGWCLGDIVSSISSEKLLKAKEMLLDFVARHPDLSIIYANQIHCRSGNKSFAITLKESSNGG